MSRLDVEPGTASITGKTNSLNHFERYLTLWVALCMGVGIILGKAFPGAVNVVRSLEFGEGSQINIPIAVLIWLMIYPMMLKVDFGSILHVGRKPKGLFVTLCVNWLIKPFSMAFLGWLFFKHVFVHWIGPELADQYVAGVIILAAAPCTAMVFVWSYLTDGDPAYTLVQVSVNDLIMLVLFAGLVAFGARFVGKAYDRLRQIEWWGRRVTGTVFILAGIYYTLAYIYEVI